MRKQNRFPIAQKKNRKNRAFIIIISILGGFIVSAKEIQQAIYQYCNARPPLKALLPIAGILLFIYPLLCVFQGIVLWSIPSMFSQLVFWLFLGALVLVFALNDMLKITVALGILALSYLVFLIQMTPSFFALNYVVDFFLYGFISVLAFRSFRKTDQYRQIGNKLKKTKRNMDKGKVLPFPQSLYAKPCPKCNEYLRGAANFCPACGTAIQHNPETAMEELHREIIDEPKPDKTENTNTCAQCGQVLRPEAKYCPACGTAPHMKETGKE